MENPSSSGGHVEAQWDISSSRKRSRRSGWDVEEPVKVMKTPHDLHFKQPNDSSLSVLGNQNRVSSAGVAVSAATAAPLSSFLPSTSISLPTTIPSVANMPAITAQVLAQQALAKSGLVVGLLSAPKLENRIYVGSLHYSLRETDIIALFSVFGPVVKCDMSYDQVLGRSKGFCFVEFQDQVTAQTAMTMDGFELAGRKIKVGRPSHVQINPNGPQIGTLIPSVTRQFNSQAASQVVHSCPLKHCLV
jgi:ribosomal protein L32